MLLSRLARCGPGRGKGSWGLACGAPPGFRRLQRPVTPRPTPNRPRVLARALSTVAAAPPAQPALVDGGSAAVVGACYMGALLWVYNDGIFSKMFGGEAKKAEEVQVRLCAQISMVGLGDGLRPSLVADRDCALAEGREPSGTAPQLRACCGRTLARFMAWSRVCICCWPQCASYHFAHWGVRAGQGGAGGGIPS